MALRYWFAYVNLLHMSHPSRTFQLVEAKLGRSLTEHARDMRQSGASWHAISLDLATRTGIPVTPETVRIWLYREPGMERIKAAS